MCSHKSKIKHIFLTFFIILTLNACIHIPSNPGLKLSISDDFSHAEARCLASPEVNQDATLLTAVWLQGLSPDNISVMSWNIYKGNVDNWQADFRKLSQERDLVLLQEASLNASLVAELNSMGEESGDDYRWAMTQAFYRDEYPNGVLTLSRHAALLHCSQYINEPIIYIPKSLLISQYPIKGTTQTLMVVNVHGINFSPGIESYQQQFSELLKVLESHAGPIVLAGDFNSWSEPRLAVLNELAQQLSLKQVFYEHGNLTTVFSHSIDHVYYRGLKVLKASSPMVTTSDHNPLLVTFAIDPSTVIN